MLCYSTKGEMQAATDQGSGEARALMVITAAWTMLRTYPWLAFRQQMQLMACSCQLTY